MSLERLQPQGEPRETQGAPPDPQRDAPEPQGESPEAQGGPLQSQGEPGHTRRERSAPQGEPRERWGQPLDKQREPSEPQREPLRSQEKHGETWREPPGSHGKPAALGRPLLGTPATVAARCEEAKAPAPPDRGSAITRAAAKYRPCAFRLLLLGCLAALCAYVSTPGSFLLHDPALLLDPRAGTGLAEVLRQVAHPQPQPHSAQHMGVAQSAQQPQPEPKPLVLGRDQHLRPARWKAAPIGVKGKRRGQRKQVPSQARNASSSAHRAPTGSVGAGGPQSGEVPSGPLARRDFRPHYIEVPITVLNASEGDPQGTCLDGSPPAYHLSRGWGRGAARWIVFLEGGAWCPDKRSCQDRATTALGSSKLMSRTIMFRGILSNDSSANPGFYDWNVAYMRYCSGASFSSNATVGRGGQRVHMAGRRVFDRVVRVLMEEEGMRNATHVLLAGCSAGGLAALLNCDHFRTMVLSASEGASHGTGAKGPLGSRESPGGGVPVVKCLSDGGFFPDTRNLRNQWAFRPVFNKVVALHRPVLSGRCLKAYNQSWKAGSVDSRCYFAENLLPYVDTPWFIFNALYDDNMIPYYYLPRPPVPSWKSCAKDVRRCTPWQMRRIHGYREEMITKVLRNLKNRARGSRAGGGGKGAMNGAYLSTCLGHCQSHFPEKWHGPRAQRIAGRTPSDIVGDWFFERSSNLTLIDGRLGENHSCAS